MSVTFTASTLGPTASSFSLTSSSGVTGSGASSPLTLQEVATGTYTYSVSGVNANGTGPSSAASNSVVVASLFAPSGAYDSIATTTVGGGGAASITFSSIPATYTHLQIRGIARATTTGSNFVNCTISYNSDTGANYAGHDLYGDGSTATAGGGGSRVPSNIGVVTFPDASIAANIFGTGIIDILDYANTSKYKTIRVATGADANGSGYIFLRSELWQNTSAISTITLTAAFAQYSSFALYGIKGA
jgi:hypothetical protein